MRMKLHAGLIFICKVLHLDSFWNRGTKELGNNLKLVFPRNKKDLDSQVINNFQEEAHNFDK